MIKAGMGNHVYQFNNEVRIQKSGGPIGLALTGEVADCSMLNWDRKYLEKLSQLGIKPLVYSRLKDDILISTASLEIGTRYSNGSLIFDDDKKNEDENKSEAKVTMEILKDIAESIDKGLKFTIDTPCNYEDGKMPALDIKVCINETFNNRMDYEFYEKPSTNPRVILANSAINSKAKRTILTQECLMSQEASKH